MSWVKVIIDDPEKREKFFPGVTNRTLIEVGALYMGYCFSAYDREPAQTVIKRLWSKKLSATPDNILSELQAEDVIQVLGCSRSKARQYISILRVLSL
jgi:hypothetical protein